MIAPLAGVYVVLGYTHHQSGAAPAKAMMRRLQVMETLLRRMLPWRRTWNFPNPPISSITSSR